MKLGIFDSGRGGEAVAFGLRKSFPQAKIITVNDHKNVPYGSKLSNEIITLTDKAIQPLLEKKCDIIIIACNTATAVAIDTLRARYPHQKFIGFEPMIKPAVNLTKTGVIAVCATPATLTSPKYHQLVKKYGSHVKILEPDCSTWAYAIENNQINQNAITDTVWQVCDKGADVIVLGCTHYLWIKDIVTQVAGKQAAVIEPSEAISRRVRSLMQLNDIY